jgi:hypothetical protein
MQSLAFVKGSGNFGDTGGVDTILLFPNGLRDIRFGSVLTIVGGAENAVATETVTIDGTVYTWVAALSVPPVANEVLVGATGNASLKNLRDAINADPDQYKRGVTYSSATQVHPTYRVPVEPTGLSLAIRSTADNPAADAVADTMTLASWSVANTVISTEAWLGACRILHITAKAIAIAPVRCTIYDAVVDSTGADLAGGAIAAVEKWKVETGATLVGMQGNGAIPIYNPATVDAITSIPANLVGLTRVGGPYVLNEYSGVTPIQREITVPVDVECPHGCFIALELTGDTIATGTNPLYVTIAYEPIVGGKSGYQRRYESLSVTGTPGPR